MIKIGFVGLSHLGLNYAVASAVKGFNVIGYDEKLNLVNDLKNKKISFFEKNLEKNLVKNFSKLKFTNKISDLKKCDIVFISQDVPTNNKGESDIEIIKNLISKTSRVIKKKCILVIMCQVYPGFCKNIRWNKNQVYYQVETLIFSEAQNRALNPERIIVGKNKNTIDSNYLKYLKSFNCPILQMNIESAELAKIAINLYLVNSVTLTNILSEVTENINGNWTSISKALKLDKRIGKYAYLKPGLGISGGNLERDLATFKKLSGFNNYYKNFSTNLINISNYRKDWIQRVFEALIKNNKKFSKIGIYGLTYKKGTSSIKNSPSIRLLKKLTKKKRFKVNVFDPLIKNFKITNKNVYFHMHIKKFLKDIEILIIANENNFTNKIDLANYRNIKIIIDPFKKILHKTSLSQKYVTMGNNEK